MTAQCVFGVLGALAVLTSSGCHRPANSAAPPSPATVATGTGIPPTTVGTDYRTLTQAELQALIGSKTGVEVVSLTSAGPDRYTGQIMAPGGIPLPLEVTVEAGQIVCDTKTPAGSTRQVITPNGVVKSTLDIR